LATIRPFRGLRYSQEMVGDLSAVTAPPYDVISPAEAEALMERHPNNVIRLILGESSDEHPRTDADYAQAARRLEDWTRSGVLRREDTSSLYVCDQEFEAGGQRRVRRGLMARVLIEDLDKGQVYGHEETIPGPKADRLKLMRVCRANLSPIFALYPGGKDDVVPLLEQAAHGAPEGEATDRNGTINRLWRVSDLDLIERLAAAMSGKPLFIADGHHRYETAVVYRDQVAGGAQGGNAASDYVLMHIVAMDDPGLVIWASHRLIRGIEAPALDAVMDKLGENFEVQEHDGSVEELLAAAEGAADRHGMGLIAGGRRRYVLTLRSEDVLAKAMPGKSADLQRLDTAILQSLILDRVLGIACESEAKKHVAYTKSAAEAEQAVQSGGFQLAFLLTATRVEQVRAIAAGREKMPPKSTYFYPKLLSGLVISTFDD